MNCSVIPYECLYYEFNLEEQFPDWIKEFDPVIETYKSQDIIYFHDFRNPNRKAQHILSEGKVLVFNKDLEELSVVSKSTFDKLYRITY